MKELRKLYLLLPPKSLATFLLLIILQNCGQDRIELNDSQKINKVLERASKTENIRSLILSEKNRVTSENYFEGFPLDSLEHLRSATKSIISILIGIGIDHGFIKSIDDPISNYLNKIPDNKKDIRIRHLLSMTSGLRWNETGFGYNDNNRAVESGNPYQFLMNLPVDFKPGVDWNYSSGDIHLLSVILTEASDMSTAEFAKKYLFEPMGITGFKWQKFGDGYYAGGSRLQLKPGDMLKIGRMMSNQGKYSGRRILSEAYIQEATKNQYVMNSENGIEEGYGLGWWTISINGSIAYMASGYGGQSIGVIPEKNLVLITTFKWKIPPQLALKQQKVAQNILMELW